GEARALGGDTHVAHHAHAHAGADGEAVDHGDHRLVHLLELLGHAVHALPQRVLAVERRRLPRAHAAHVAAGAEGAPGAGDDHDVDIVVALGLGQRLLPRVDHVA